LYDQYLLVDDEIGNVYCHIDARW